MIQVNKLLTTLLISVMVTSAYAVKIEVMPTVGKAVYKAKDDTLKDDEILYGIRGAVFLNDQVGVQAAYEASTSNEVGTLGAETDIERVSANIIYEMNHGKRIRPYGIIGVGNESTHGLTAPALNQGSQGFVHAGAGLKFGITKRVDLITEAKWMRKLSNNDDDVIATIGLGVNTGSSVKPAAQIPSVQATTDIQNAINLAEFRKISEKGVTQKITQTEVVEKVAAIEPAVVETIPADAIIIDEEITDIVENEFIEEMAAPTSEDGFYIQMAALFKGDGKVLTDRLEQKDYHYVLHNVERRGKTATLILVGPYQSKVEANIARGYLKRLKKDAFIYHMN